MKKNILLGIGLLIGFAILILRAGDLRSEPLFQAAADNNAKVVLHSDKCALKEVSNLPRRATWHEGDKVFEGCYGLRPDARVVVFYFSSDKTVGLAPMSAFTKVVGI